MICRVFIGNQHHNFLFVKQFLEQFASNICVCFSETIHNHFRTPKTFFHLVWSFLGFESSTRGPNQWQKWAPGRVMQKKSQDFAMPDVTCKVTWTWTFTSLQTWWRQLLPKPG